MIKCQVCYRQFKRINIFHLKTHDIKNETEYLKLYPGSKLFDENSSPNHYIGLEISGFLHLGSLISTGFKINDFIKAGRRFNFCHHVRFTPSTKSTGS